MAEEQRGNLMSINVIFTGMYRDGPNLTDMTLLERVGKLKRNGISKIYWYTWKEQNKDVLENLKEIMHSHGVDVRIVSEPFPHVRGIQGRQRQIYNIKYALQDFEDKDIILKLRWDVDFNEKLLHNIQEENFLSNISNGLIDNKVWTGFYSIQEMFSPADTSFCGYKRDLDRLINFDYKIHGVSSNNYISHDCMMLMPSLLSLDEEVCNIIKLEKPEPNSLMFKESDLHCDARIRAWAFSYYLLYKYFKTGPLGSCYFKRGDQSRWPYSFVDYNTFLDNYYTVTRQELRTGLYPKYRVYDDVFIKRLVEGYFSDHFSDKICETLHREYNL